MIILGNGNNLSSGNGGAAMADGTERETPLTRWLLGIIRDRQDV